MSEKSSSSSVRNGTASELGLVTVIVALAAQRADGRRVKRVLLEIGKLSSIVPDSVRFCFDKAAEGTVLQGATLEILEVAARGKCRKCSRILVAERPNGRCLCGGVDVAWESGTEVRIVAMELV